jgi:hypothetical protein
MIFNKVTGIFGAIIGEIKTDLPPSGYPATIG